MVVAVWAMLSDSMGICLQSATSWWGECIGLAGGFFTTKVILRLTKVSAPFKHCNIIAIIILNEVYKGRQQGIRVRIERILQHIQVVTT